jgi:hypothetical protein
LQILLIGWYKYTRWLYLSQHEDDEANLNSYTTAVVLRIAYGIEITSEDDQYVKIAAGISDALSNGGSPGSTMVDVFPLSMFFPLKRTDKLT